MESPYSSPQSNAKRLEKLNAANGVGSFVSPLRNKRMNPIVLIAHELVQMPQ